jgi:hypothetical protein
VINWAIIGTILNKTWNQCKHKYDQLVAAEDPILVQKVTERVSKLFLNLCFCALIWTYLTPSIIFIEIGGI